MAGSGCGPSSQALWKTVLVRDRRMLGRAAAGLPGGYGLCGLPGPSLPGERCRLSSLLERSMLSSLVTCSTSNSSIIEVSDSQDIMK